jgi:cytochrome P450
MVIYEVLRWRHITPLGIPHAVTQDDEYMGFRIPRGTKVLANNWVVDSDETLFKDPAIFRPERWLETPKLPTSAVGFRRREYPGQHVGQQSLFIVISRLMWGYDFTHALDVDGGKNEINWEKMLQSSLSGPVDLRAQLIVQPPRHQELIEAGLARLETDVEALLTIPPRYTLKTS